MTPLNKYQTFSRRFLSSVIDGIIFLPLIILINGSYNDQKVTSYLVYYSLYVILFTMYLVISHGKYGQTIGKRLMGIKVLDLDETKLIGYKRAFLRESIWFGAELVCIILILFSYNSDLPKEPSQAFDIGYLSFISSLWLLIEVITMLFNKKRRALHDYMAGSVVVKESELLREQIQVKQKNLIESLN